MPPPAVSNRVSTLRLAGLAFAILVAASSLFIITQDASTLSFSKPPDMLTVAALLVTVIIGLEAAGAIRVHQRIAARRPAYDAVTVAFSRQLQSCTDLRGIASAVVEHIAKLFDCHAVFVSAENLSAILTTVPADATLSPYDLGQVTAAFHNGVNPGYPVQPASTARWQFYPIAWRERSYGAVGLARSDGRVPVMAGDRELLNALLDLAGLALKRVLLEAAETEARILRESERMRAALLATISEDVKPRLLSIQVSLRALRRKSASEGKVSALAEQVAKLLVAIDGLAELAPGEGLGPVTCGPLTIDVLRHQVTRDGQAIHLTPKEFALLAELARHAGRALPHHHLLRVVWGAGQEDRIDYLRVAIRALRQKLEADPAAPVLILNEPAVGYRLSWPQTALTPTRCRPHKIAPASIPCRTRRVR